MGRDSAVVVTWTGSGRGQGGGVKRWGERSEKTASMYVITSHANQCSLLQLTLTAVYVIEALAKFGLELRWYHT